VVLSPGSFVQANPAVAALLYARAVELLAAGPRDDVLDLYCGSGALAFHLARRARSVYAVDLNHRALADARASAARNATANVVWRAGKCETIARKLVRAGRRFPAATVNPPRTGLHEDLPVLLDALGVQRLVYVSCSPPTLARDLARLRTLGFAVRQVVPFDMFAQTYHLETVTLLERAAGGGEPAAGGG
jgi:23S rRNA (uracil1939-C5)-methyltransferase